MIVAGQHTGVGGSRRMYQINTSNAICRIWLLGSDHFAGQSILCILYCRVLQSQPLVHFRLGRITYMLHSGGVDQKVLSE
jgi:hypothetical protein